jgi:hypothetical protein
MEVSSILLNHNVRYCVHKIIQFVPILFLQDVLIHTIYNLPICVVVSGVRLSPLGTAATTGLLYWLQMIDEGDCGEISGMKIGRGNRSTRRKPAPVSLCPPQIPHDQTRARTWVAAVGSQRLTASATVWPISHL